MNKTLLILLLSSFSCFAEINAWNGVTVSTSTDFSGSTGLASRNGVALKSSGGGGGPTPGEPITAQTAGFDGTDDYLTISSSSGLVEFGDAKTVTVSFWIDFTGGDGSQQVIFKAGASGGASRFLVWKLADNTIQFLGRNAANTTILEVGTTSTRVAADGWVHVFACFDLTDTAKRKIYLNGVSETLVVTTYSNDTLDLNAGASAVYRIGTTETSTLDLSASMCELWMDNIYLDAPELFEDAAKPLDLGSDGSDPTSGTPPAVYLSLVGNGSNWRNDSSGNGNTFTASGGLGGPAAP